MKRDGFRVLMSLIAVVMLGMPATYAGPEGSLNATIPFDFIVGKTTLPAGQYTVSAANDGHRALVVRSEDAKSTAIALTMGVRDKSAKNQPRLEFIRYGNKYFLSKVWRGYDNEGRSLHKSSLEREIAMNHKSAMVTLAAQAR
jgi:hypothetical protein